MLEEVDKVSRLLQGELSNAIEDMVRSCEDSDEFNDFDFKIEAFKEEQILMERQFEVLRSKNRYPKLDNNLTFLARLEDFCRLVKPDSNFSIPNNVDLDEARESYFQEDDG